MKLNTEVFAALLYRVLDRMPEPGRYNNEFGNTVKALADSDAEEDIMDDITSGKNYKILLDELKKVYPDQIELDEANGEWKEQVDTQVFATFLYRALGTMPPDGAFCQTVKTLSRYGPEQESEGDLKESKEYKIFLDELKKVYGDEIELDETFEEWLKAAGWY